MSETHDPRFNRKEDIDVLWQLEDDAQTALSGDDVMVNLAREVVMADIMTGLDPEGWYEGWESQWANMDRQFRHVKDLTAEMRDMTWVCNGSFASLGMHVHAITQQGKRPITFRELDGFRKTRGGRWLLTMSHVYFPVDRETGRYDLNAEIEQQGPVQWSPAVLRGPAVPVEQAEEELRAWFASRIVAASADEVMRHFAADEDVLAFGPYIPGLHRGQDDVRAHYERELAGVVSVISDCTDCHVHTDGELAMILSRQHVTQRLGDGGTRHVSVRHSASLRRNGDRWEALMEMISFPVNETTGEVLMDLRPGIVGR